MIPRFHPHPQPSTLFSPHSSQSIPVKSEANIFTDLFKTLKEFSSHSHKSPFPYKDLKGPPQPGTPAPTLVISLNIFAATVPSVTLSGPSPFLQHQACGCLEVFPLLLPLPGAPSLRHLYSSTLTSRAGLKSCLLSVVSLGDAAERPVSYTSQPFPPPLLFLT